MFASLARTRVRRRGVVLVVVLGMLGLLALIGVTFATFSNQAQINARNFSQSMSFPDATEMMDYALSQLVDDTANPQSVIRGHSLKRDMYGNDAANNGALFNGRPDGAGPIVFQGGSTAPSYVSIGQFAGLIKCVTNIQSGDPAFYGYDFTRWLVKFAPASQVVGRTYFVNRTLEVLVDDPNDQSGYRAFYVAAPNDQIPIPAGTAKRPGTDPTISGYVPAGQNAAGGAWSSFLINGGISNTIPVGIPLVLDGRFLRAFNGAGMAGMGVDQATGANQATLPHPMPEYANFRFNGNILANNLYSNPINFPNYRPSYGPGYGDPNLISGMDEDYDAADLENWFLSIQSADGQVVVPSFHRPGILTANDWSLQWNSNGTQDQQVLATRAMSKVLRPRAIDGHSPISFPDLKPDTTGKITYDVDNDGDGTTDAVWLDLGYPPKRNAEGQLFKPLFAFTVIGLNGKLPLNTAGNLQNRIVLPGASASVPEHDHAEHYGTSPSELDLRYALQNAYDPLNPNAYGQIDNAGMTTAGQWDPTTVTFTAGDKPIPVGLTQLRNLLAGNRQADPNYDPKAPAIGSNTPTANFDINWVLVNGFPVLFPNGVADVADVVNNGGVTRATPPVAGRWGEEDNVPQFLPAPPNGSPVYIYNNHVGAGHSGFPYSPNAAARDARDDNFNAFDVWPAPGNAEGADYYDFSGSLSLPVERIRRFVTPIDTAGDGRITTFNGGGRRHADLFGRVSFLSYFRPPGLPLMTLNTAAGVLAAPGNNPVYPDVTNNPYHGFESYNNPAPTNGIGNALLATGMPSDMRGGSSVAVYSGGSASLPTFDADINSKQPSPGLNEADEMNLYTPSRLDSPYGPSDLEWLYRFQDVDGAQLNSRLGQLAPISFLNPRDGARRRRLFALDAWETTNYVWANDNPSNAFPNNSRFAQAANASFYAVNNVGFNNTPVPDPAFDFSVQSQVTHSGFKGPVPTPSIAHRDRKININFPLPVSNSPYEPVRQKWVREAYQFLKATLPPKAVDTPEELAQLSQFLVNLVDFRDPDCTMTKFVNTDVIVLSVSALMGNQGTQSTLMFSSLANQPVVRPAYDPNYTEADRFLVQYGMEYQPVAINEVALSFQTKKQEVAAPSNANYTTRFFVELLNTLTKDGINNVPDTSDMDLAGWDFVVLPDNSLGRPDPFTGQIPTQPAVGGSKIRAYPITSDINFNNGQTAPFLYDPTNGGMSDQPIRAIGGMTTRVQALASTPGGGADTNSYFLFGNPVTATVAGANNQPSVEMQGPVPTPTYPTTDTMGKLFDKIVTNELVGNEGQYFWLYLRRPPNPFDTSYDPSFPNTNRVVVDSFRFVYTQANGKAYTDPGPPKKDTNSGNGGVVPSGLYFSLQRMQPFRGGQAVPPLPAAGFVAPSKFVMTAYGYSEQTSVAPGGLGSYGNYGGPVGPSTRTTTEILHTLGTKNNPSDASWDYLPFLDRDFTSMVEMLMVPSCSPGLFTKQFAEVPPPINDTSTGVANSQPRLWVNGTPFDPTQWAGSPWPAAGSGPVRFLGNTSPHSNPYLNDEFFYSGASEPVLPNNSWPHPAVENTVRHYVSPSNPNNYVGGPGGAGWHKMLEFFEVPSPAFGSIGEVASGTNYDWARQDLKPGLINLNLVVDEEVFLGVMGQSFYGDPLNPASHVALNQVQIGIGSGVGLTPPALVTQVDDNGTPTRNGYYLMPNVGIYDQFTDPISGTAFSGNAMKACFADFLKLRHGGSGFMYAYGRDQTGAYGQTVNNTTYGVAPERPFHSLSYPDIDFTVLRPATIPPSVLTNPVNSRYPAYAAPVGTPTAVPFANDPGVKNPYLYTRNDPVQPPPIPARRLFQVPDWWGSVANQTPVSNAAQTYSGITYTGDPVVNTQTIDGTTRPAVIAGLKLYHPKMDLTQPATTATNPPTNIYLGGANTGGPNAYDQRDHPYFRTEMLQKVVNLTTVRTHQYAVWITVGFFEVTNQGDPALAGVDFTKAYDTLGLELGVLDGRNVRYRGFFLVDRTKAVGFNPSLPGDFRSAVVYRQLIE